MKRLIPLFVLSLLACACSRPCSYEQFVKAAEGPVYGFELEMADSLGYDIDFYTRVDISPLKLRELADVGMNIVWISPSGQSYAETVYLPLCGQKGERLPYRKGLAVSESGTWRLEVEVEDQPGGFCGLGIILQENGTR